jgi:tRNA threonylcarbamoyladenosine dehydratase
MSNERFKRAELFLGEQAFSRLQGSFVVVAGLGAVGSYAVEALARCGVRRLRLVDFDVVRLSNINRQLFALSSTVGEKKCEVARRRVLDINPECAVEAAEVFIAPETVESVIGGRPDFVIDAIDSVNPKVELITSLLGSGLPFVSSLGAALRSDPGMVRIGKFSEVRSCPLARQVRKRLKKRTSMLDFNCGYSLEPCRGSERILPPEEEPLVEGRARNVLGSLPTLTGIFGLTCANFAIQQISGQTGE